jgi:pimeloyl-ACP methyl ester carboxylesterase
MSIFGFSLRHPSVVSFGLLGAVSLSAILALRSRAYKKSSAQPWIPSPRETLLPQLSDEEIASLPYPPNVIPGAGRDVQTPYGTTKVFEWGPEDGEKVLLLHGIGTPCLALSDLAQGLVDAGYRVMLFDFFGRGYSDAPCDLPYDLRLYTSQILLVLASSKLAWTGDNGFHLIGYSLGSGVAMSFTRYYHRMVRSVSLVCGSGLIRKDHISWKSKILYSTGIFPEWLLQHLVKRRITPKDQVTEESVAQEAVQPRLRKKQKNSDASGGNSFDHAPLSKKRPGHTVASVMSWQLKHHRGFVHAFMNSIRHAPIYEETEDWREVGNQLAARRTSSASKRPPGLTNGKILLVLGSADPVIIADELIMDASSALDGENGLTVKMIEGGHEIAIAKGYDAAQAILDFWNKDR